MTTDSEQQQQEQEGDQVGVSKQPRASEQAGGVSVYKAEGAPVGYDCNGPWSGYPHCEGKMAVSDICSSSD